MRAATFIAPVGPPQPVSADPTEVFDRGEAPRHCLAGPIFRQDGARLIFRGAPGDPVLVRLPRRLTRIPVEDTRRWIRGEEPEPNALFPGLMDLGFSADPWERRYPRRGLGLPKTLPRRRRRGSPQERSALFDHISSSLHKLGVAFGQALNTAARERLLGARATVEEAVERAAPGTIVNSYEVTDACAVSVQLLVPFKAIQLRMVTSSDVVRVTED